jgi:hypothetical protein
MKTKNYLLIFIAACLCIAGTIPLQAQFPGNITPAVVLGIQKSSITGSDSWKDPIGMQVGIIVPFLDISEALSLRAEASLSMQGAKWEGDGYDGRTNLLYINVPVVVRYQLPGGFFGEAGLQPGLLVSARDKYDDYTDSYMDYMNKFDLSIPVGIGYEFGNNIGVGLRVIPGITDITEDSDDKDHNLVFALRVTYTFNK